MPKSTLDIEVNDQQFKEYVAAFERYREQTREMPKEWADVNDSVVAIGAGFTIVTLELERQFEVTQRLSEERRKVAKEEKEAREEKRRIEKEAEDREKEAEKRRKTAVEQTKQIAKNIAETVVGLGKWALIGEGASLIGGALTFWGLDKLVSSVGQERRLAQGFGVTTGQRQALDLNLQRYFDVNSLLENVAETKADPNRWWVFKTMGLNPNEGNAQLSMDTALRARQMFITDRGNEALAQAQGLTTVFSMDELRRLAATPEAQLRSSMGQAQSDLAPGGRAYLADQVSLKWQNFIVALDGAGLALKNKLVDKLSQLEPNLERIIGKLADLGIAILDNIDWAQLNDGLSKFTQYIASKQFQADFKTVIDDIDYAAHKLVGAMKLLGLLPDAAPAPLPGENPTPMPGPGQSVAQDPTAPGGYWTHDIFGNPHLNAPQNPFWDEAIGKVGQLTGGDISKGTKVASALQRDLGLGSGAAAGIVGNLLAEDPSLVAMNEKHPLRGRGGWGWAMWTGPRRIQFEQWVAAHHLDIHSDEANYGFLVYELKTKFQGLLKKIQHESAAQAAADIYTTFESPPKGDKTLPVRIAKAVKVDVNLTNQTGANVAPTVNAASR
jgi:tail lysozyme